MESESLARTLRQEIVLARQRIYAVGQRTPLEAIQLDDCAVFIKREDLSPIHAYKWRGAYNRMAQLNTDELARGVVTASAGNHAQGVALAAQKLGTTATIYMPLATPRMKQAAVKRHGGNQVEIKLVGDSYDAASAAAHDYAARHDKTYIHAYDSIAVMAGQGTLADEIVLSEQGPFDVAFLQVGGGGLAAATATWLKLNFPDIRIIGVEGVGQASMAAAIQAGHPIALDHVDIFCDGTAVRQVGELTYSICKEAVDEWMTVSNDEVSAAIQFLWEELRCIPEPSGAMGMAAILKRREQLQGQRVLAVLCGANMDFEQLATIARQAAVGASRRRYLRITIAEQSGAMHTLLESLPETVNIVDFQYGKTDSNEAHPVIGFDVNPLQFEALRAALKQNSYPATEVTTDSDVRFRLIHYESRLLAHPFFLTLEFHERPGALAEFLRAVSPHANLCYFNYVYSGERVGRALLGFEFVDADAQARFPEVLASAAQAYRAYTQVDATVLQRIIQ
ncbi:MAG: threonine ammonia-lyase, biosynthetic [Opitutales bacterium]